MSKLPGWLQVLLILIIFVGSVWAIRAILYFAFGYVGLGSNVWGWGPN